MKRKLALALALCCAVTALSGCGGQKTTETTENSGTETENQQTEAYTLEKLRAQIGLDSLLKQHQQVGYTEEFYEYRDGETDKTLTSTIKGRYWRENDMLQSDTEYLDANGSVTYTQQEHGDATYAGASYGLSADGTKYMSLMLPEEYDRLTDRWLSELTNATGEQTVQETAEQDGKIVVTVRTDYRSESDMYDIALYYIDPQSGDLTGSDITTYSTANDQPMAETLLTPTYDDGSFRLEAKPFEAITGGTDYCEVTMIANPQQDEMQVCWYPVAHDTQLTFSSLGNVKLYADEELTQTLDGTAIDVSGETRNVFAVREQ